MQIDDWVSNRMAATFDALVSQYFGPDPDDLSHVDSDIAVERLRADFDRERSREHKFKLWALLHIFDEAPAPDVTFSDPAEHAAARDFVDLVALPIFQNQKR